MIKTHSMLGAEMLQKTESFADQPLLQTATRSHAGTTSAGTVKATRTLKGDDIPISAQLVSMADVYDALTSERCYKKGFPARNGCPDDHERRVRRFNPLLLQCLLDVQGELKQEILQW